MTDNRSLDLLQIAAEHVTTGARHASPSGIRRVLRQDHSVTIEHETSRTILAQLHAAGIVAPVDLKTHAHPVLMTSAEATRALEEYRRRGEDWGPFYECPNCCRVAQWTSGRMVSAGDEVDEFWCQTCGAEVPLSACTVIGTAA